MQVLGALTGIQTNIFKTDVFFGRRSDSLSQLLLLAETKRGLFVKDPAHSHLLQDALRRRCSAPHPQWLRVSHWKMGAFIPKKIYTAFIQHNQLDITYTLPFRLQYSLLTLKNHDMKTFQLAICFPS